MKICQNAPFPVLSLSKDVDGDACPEPVEGNDTHIIPSPPSILRSFVLRHSKSEASRRRGEGKGEGE